MALAVTVTVWAVEGKVYVEDALPLLPVIAVGVPKVPPLPPSLKVTLTPCTGFPLFVAKTASVIGRVVLTWPLWLLPAFTVRDLVAPLTVSVNVPDV